MLFALNHRTGLRMPLLAALLSLAVATTLDTAAAQSRPNILWITCEDTSPAHIGCYGDGHALTPNIDRLATQAVRYTHAFSVAGVCAPSRSAIITGMYQTSLGTQHMRCTARLPDQVRCFTEYLRAAGYYCTNNSKTDYNFAHPAAAWDESSGKAHWRNRPRAEQPFFAVFNFTTSHEGHVTSDRVYEAAVAALPRQLLRDPATLELPPYYPDTPAARREWARYYDVATAMDVQVGEILAQLDDDGLAESTIVFFYSDHGDGLPRAKRWLYDSGLRVPMLVRIPPSLAAVDQGRPGTVSDELVSFVDLAPTVLNLASVPRPEHLQGRAFIGPSLSPPREYVYGARDRMDERYDIIRAVRDRRYKYIRNYEPWKAYYQYMNTAEKSAIMRELRRVHAEGRLPPPAARFMAAVKPREELYDLDADPHEIHNLADSPAPEHRQALERLRAAHQRWVLETRDTGLVPEPELIARESVLGSRYAILRQADGDALARRLLDTAAAAGDESADVRSLASALDDPDAAVRYWAAIGLAGAAGPSAESLARLRQALADDSPAVQLAAAGALARLGQVSQAIDPLTRLLASDQQWVRLGAALALDEMGEHARPAVEVLRKALEDRQNKYVVRVANRALNELLGARNEVP